MNKELTRRENEVIRLLADGYSNLEIASELGLGYQTVKNYVTNAYRKLGKSRYTLIQEAANQTAKQAQTGA